MIRLSSGLCTEAKLDVHLYHPHQSFHHVLSSDTHLSFLSVVDLAKVPLYLVAGPSLNVWSDNEATEDWFATNLLHGQNLDLLDDELRTYSTVSSINSLCRQPDRGLLVRVGPSEGVTSETVPGLTELLFYAAISPSSEGRAGLPTPPRSSSPTSTDDIPAPKSHGTTKQATLFALPLSSNQTHQTNAFQELNSTAQDKSADGFAQFMRGSSEETQTTQIETAKSQNLSSLFDDASQNRKRMKRRGGEGISKAMAGIDGQHLHRESFKCLQSEKDKTTPVQEDEHRKAGRKSLSRGPSGANLGVVEHTRPPSRRETFSGKRSSLNRVTSVASSINQNLDGPENDVTIEQQNRSALTKVVMAGMRLYGLQQKKKCLKTRDVSENPISTEETPDPAQLADIEDEYKLVYHQTFKAASFAFRAHLAAKTISQVAMRDVVDKLLAMFCTDPFPIEEIENYTLPGYSTQDKTSVRGFETRAEGSESACASTSWSTPNVRKRFQTE